MKKFILVLTTLSLIGCAGRTPAPIHISRPGDHDLSCRSIEAELAEIDGNIKRLIPESQKTGTNVGLGVAGAFLIVPWFFMDFSDAERVEIEAYRARYNLLTRLYNDKKCGQLREEIPPLPVQ